MQRGAEPVDATDTAVPLSLRSNGVPISRDRAFMLRNAPLLYLLYSYIYCFPRNGLPFFGFFPVLFRFAANYALISMLCGPYHLYFCIIVLSSSREL